MAMIKKFCCGCNVRSGSIFSGFYCLVASGLFIGLLCVRYVGYRLVDGSETYAIAAYATIAIFALLLCTSVTLIIGVYMDIQALFAPWLVICVLCIVEGCSVLLWYIIGTLRQGKQVPTWEIVITIFHVINSIILIYCMVCIISQLQDLMAGKGTRRYYRRRRHLRRQRLPPHITPIPVEMMGDMGPHIINLPPGHNGPTFPPPPYADSPPPYDPMADDDAEYSDHANDHVMYDHVTNDIDDNQAQEPIDTGHGGAAMYAGNGEREERTNRTPENTDPASGTTNQAFDPEPGPSQRPRDPPPNFHFGDDDLILSAPLEISDNHEHSPERQNESPRRRKKTKKKKVPTATLR